MHHASIAHLSTARDALHAATCAGHFPERDEVVDLHARVSAIVQAGTERAPAGPSAPKADAPAAYLCPFSACADTGLLANGELCACSHG